ncbi:L,D-transpeptidase family protein [Lutimonas halocynthiae]|uniref:L,D-transpeptidase family protein n=1 Tax=Lutimonas halocynthiae TaxID=1446477 RepID=UPI0025B5D57C|nr:L,D-transpeptidase family protein [Lutimonas halocynthiae]MDN3642388.1 L,D-transpeptidase family protein [Lutimonas halocynthiae]
MTKLKILVLFFIFISTSTSINAQEQTVEQVLESKVLSEEGQNVVAVNGIELFSQEELPQFYSNRDFEPAWNNSKNKKDLIESLESSFDEGLSPNDYHLEMIKLLTDKSKKGKLSHQERADLDLLMTDALILYASHLMEGKLEQSDLRKTWDVERNEGPSNPDSLLTATLHNKRIKVVLEEFKPTHYMYKLMKLQLKKLRTEAAEGGWPLVSEGETLKPGDTSARVVEIRNYLMAVGDLKKYSVENEEVFDTIVEAAVKDFQVRHKLTSDGVIGKGTIEQMRVPIEDRIDMIILNLERTRWIFQHPDDDFLIVNIAGFHVKRITNKKEVFDSRVIVGKFHKETPVFKGVMKYIDMNPTWTLPYSISTHETLPKLKKDPGYLAAKHMEVMDRNGKILDPSTIDWNQYSRGNFPFIIRQKAGPWNALGEVKFMFPNKYAVYLHDTPSRGLFNRQDRAFSHGCIRTEDKWGLMMSLMDDPDVWNMDKINEILKSGKTTTITLPKPVNIYLIYLTAAVDQDNNLMFMKDVYKRDKAVITALKEPFHFNKVR